MRTKRKRQRFEKAFGQVSLGYSDDYNFNQQWKMMGLMCPYEHCIETMPLIYGEDSCPVFGHDCPDILRCPYAQ